MDYGGDFGNISCSNVIEQSDDGEPKGWNYCGVGERMKLIRPLQRDYKHALLGGLVAEESVQYASVPFAFDDSDRTCELRQGIVPKA